MRLLPASFFAQPTRRVARQLLGCVLFHRQADQLYSGIITETEAYCGPHDTASHASRGRTRRTEVMFGPPGHTYVYLIYGMYHCLNVVTEKTDYPAAVLIRGIQAFEPIAATQRWQYDQATPLPPKLANGPGKLCRYMDITTQHNNQLLSKANGLWIANAHIKPKMITTAPRVGIDYAGAYTDKPWRYIATDFK